MSREWKPGDVALATDGRRFMRGETYWWGPRRNGEGGRLYADHELETPLRPLAVIDPEDREQIDALCKSLVESMHHAGDARSAANGVHPATMKIALCNLADPPKCPAALNVKGEHFGCDRPKGHGLAHGNTNAGAIWGDVA